MPKTMYFGTRERMAWVKAPAINADISGAKWGTSGTYLNGGGYVRTSGAFHRVYQFAWNLAPADDIYGVLDYASGLYGDDLIYFLDPFAIDQNVLPMYWSAPRLAKEDAPSLVDGQRPTLAPTGVNALKYPTQSAVYTLNSTSKSAKLFIPVPPGYTFHLGVHGSATGTATVVATPDNAAAVNATVLGVTSSQRTNVAISGTTGVTLSVAGTGVLTLAGLIAQVRPTGQAVPSGEFISGRGHSGVRFDGVPTLTGYSAPDALDLQGATATLRETGAWE